jgi:hypothetical protein
MNRSGRPALALLLAVAATVGTTTAAATAAGAASRAGAARPSAATPLFDAPDAMAVVGADLFVADRASNAVTEVATASPAKLVHSIHGSAYGFSTPDAMVAYGSDVIVASLAGNVSSFSASTGAHLWTAAAGDGLNSPDALSLVGSNLFVADSGAAGPQVTELDAANGKLVRIVHGKQYGFDDPVSIAHAPAGMFVVNQKTDSVTEFNETTGAFVRQINGSRYQFNVPAGSTSDGTNVWVADSGNDSFTEFSASTGALVAVFNNSDAGYGLTDPGPIAFGDKQVYIASPPGSSPMITGAWVSNGGLNFWMCNANDSRFKFDNPQALLVSGGSADLWIANEGGNSITEISAATGDYIAYAS